MVENPSPAITLVQRRRDVLASLANDADTRAELVSATGLSETTVTRALWELQTARLVERRGTTYHLGCSGRTVFDAYDAFCDDVVDIQAATPLIEHIDDPSMLEPRAVIGGAVHIAEPPTPQKPVNVVADLFQGSTRVRIGSRAFTNARFPEQQTQLAVEERAETEIIFEKAVFEMAITEFPGMLERNVMEGDVTIYTIDSLPFAAGLFEHDDAVWTVVVVYGENARVVGSLVNDAPAAAQWVNESLDTWRAQATDVTGELRE